MDVRARDLLARQEAIVARRQLRRAGLTAGQTRGLVRDWRELHDGVYLAGFAEPTERQLFRAAALSAPRSVLSHASAARYYDLPARYSGFETITRPGRRGPQRIGDLLVHYSQTLNGNVTAAPGFPVTTPERTAIDLSPHLNDWDRRKLLREALRQRRTTIARMQRALAAHHGRRGTAFLNALVSRYQRLELHRARSDAEAYAMEVLDNARLTLPRLNHDVAGKEADLSWPYLNLIIEIDGDQWHRDKAEDAAKTRIWRAAGYTVRRLPADVLFDDPRTLIALATSEGVTRAAR